MTTISDTVSYRIEDRIGLIEINNPPVNACAASVRHGLTDAIATLAPKVDAIAIYGAGRCFIAGADITELGKPLQMPSIPEVCVAIEDCPKPVIAVLHGPTLGGGLEVAISAHARIALPDLQTGFPEVTLGVLPGAGGTQRGPRLIEIEATLDLALTGRRIGAEEARTLGLVDQIREGRPDDIARQAALDAAEGALPVRKTRELTVAAADAALETTAADLRQRQAHLFSPHRIVECIARSTGDFAEGMAFERAAFQACIESPQRAGLIHAFFAERAVAKIPEAAARPRDVATVGVVGGGTMGTGIATAALLAGMPVTLCEQTDARLDAAQASIAQNLTGAVKRGKLSDAARDKALAVLTLTRAYDAFAACDLVVEAVFEDLAAKQEVFRKLDEVCRPGAILATNTSYLDVNEIAAATTRPADVIGLHFFSPAHVMRLLEVVVGDATAPDVVATGFHLAKRLRKIAVRSGVCDGFIGNRILSHARKAAEYLMIDGALPDQIDRALTEFGFAMGPFAVMDLAGLDISWAARKRRAATRPATERYVAVGDRLCEAGWFGRKSGRGYYLYGDGTGLNPDAVDIITAERARAGVTPRAFDDAEIVTRILTAMASEAIRCVEDGTALRPIDVDAVKLFGYGFPRHHGGPLHWADQIGAAALVETITRLAQEDRHFWQVPQLLRDLAESGGSFAARNI